MIPGKVSKVLTPGKVPKVLTFRARINVFSNIYSNIFQKLNITNLLNYFSYLLFGLFQILFTKTGFQVFQMFGKIQI